MDTKTLLQALKKVVREEVRQVIKEELTEILQEGLQSTITEMKQPSRTTNIPGHRNPPAPPKRKPTAQFSENRWASILNETDILPRDEQTVPSYAELMTEDLHMTSADAMNFGAQRKAVSNMQMHPNIAAPRQMVDPETGKNMEVAPEVAQAMTRDYSALMKAIDKKKGR